MPATPFNDNLRCCERHSPASRRHPWLRRAIDATIVTSRPPARCATRSTSQSSGLVRGRRVVRAAMIRRWRLDAIRARASRPTSVDQSGRLGDECRRSERFALCLEPNGPSDRQAPLRVAAATPGRGSRRHRQRFGPRSARELKKPRRGVNNKTSYSPHRTNASASSTPIAPPPSSSDSRNARTSPRKSSSP